MCLPLEISINRALLAAKLLLSETPRGFGLTHGAIVLLAQMHETSIQSVIGCIMQHCIIASRCKAGGAR